MIRKKTSVASHGVTVTMIVIGVVIQSVIVVILNVMFIEIHRALTAHVFLNYGSINISLMITDEPMGYNWKI